MTKRGGSGARPQQRARKTRSTGDPGTKAAPATAVPADVVPAETAGPGSEAVRPAGSSAAAGTAAPRRGRRWPAVVLPLLGALLLAGAALAYVLTSPARYSAEALVAVLSEDTDGAVSEPLTSIWVEIGNSDAVLDRVTDELGVSRSALDEGLTVSVSSSAPLISIRASTGDAERSAAWANATAEALLDEDDADRVPGWSLEQVTSAQPAQRADQPPTLLLVAAGAVLGALVGASAAQLLAARARRRGARA
ncbi:hypothetical protein [Blastococcus sp. TF02-8]|uniref:hypothetical protein n=1 Tax=Blastococcus sp. TF02-8 TaxID=2250574 RepID=UPI001412B2E2|nr:hypothetical protein [Blastococcus sp. TF02-8]